MKTFKISCRCGTFQYDLFGEEPKLQGDYVKSFYEAGTTLAAAVQRVKEKVPVLEVLECQECGAQF